MPGGIKVIDHTHLSVGAYCAQQFPDNGTNIIKVEHPRHRGTVARRASGSVNAHFASMNRVENSVALLRKGLTHATNRSDLVESPQYQSYEGCSNTFARILKIVEVWTSQPTREDSVATLGDQGLPVAPVHDTSDVLDSERPAKRGMLVDSDSDDGVGVSILMLPADAALRSETPRNSNPRLGDRAQNAASEFLTAIELDTTGMAGAFEATTAKATA